MYANDKIEGLPKQAEADAVHNTNYAEGANACSEDEYVRTVTAHGVPRSWIHTVPGWFSATCNRETAARVGLGQIAVAHVDCDILSSTMDVLHLLGEVMVDGGLIV